MGGTLPLSVGGIPFEKRPRIGAEFPSPTLFGPDGAVVPFDTVDAGLEGWVLLKPRPSLVTGAYTVRYVLPPPVDCIGFTSKMGGEVIVDVVDAAPFPTAIGDVEVADEDPWDEGDEGGKRTHAEGRIHLTPSPELVPFLPVTAWRVTLIPPGGTRNAYDWDWEGYGSTAAVLVYASGPASGVHRVEVEAQIPGQAILETETTWDVGVLEAPEPVSRRPPEEDTGCSVGRNGRANASAAALVLAAIAMASRRRR